MSPLENANHEMLASDVVVIGAGGSGLAAAVTAAGMGAKVMVIEKRSTPGGNTLFVDGIFAAESPTQKRMNIDARRDAFFQLHMNYSQWSLNARLVRAFIDKSGDTIRWMEEKGLTFRLAPFYYNQSPLVFHFLSGKGPALIKVLIKDCKDSGVNILYETRAVKLLTDSSKTVIGVQAQAQGKDLIIKANCVIIATGGYGGNRELLKKYFPLYDEHLMTNGLKDSHTGDGIMMAFDVGAAAEGLGNLQSSGPHSNVFGLAVSATPSTIWVNKNGERFMDENATPIAFESANGILRQPEQTCFSVFDEAVKQNLLKNGVWRPSGLQIPNPAKLEEDLKNGADKGNVKISDSWEELATWMGVDSNVLDTTITEYNTCCERGLDSIFNKDSKYLLPLRTPPYYAVKCSAHFLTTIGGIKINHRMEVLDKKQIPIKGLYAVGNDTGGWSSSTYNARLTGHTSAFAINSGRIAGENAASYVETLRTK